MKSSEFLNEAPAAAPAPAVPAQPAAAAPVTAKPAGQQPFKPTQVMDPQQAAAANKAAQEFMQGLMAQLQQIKPVAESRKLNENWFTDKVAAAANWVQQKLKENPLIEIGLRFLPVTSTVLAITDVIGAIKGGNLTDATRMLANLIPGGQQLAQAIGVGQAATSGDVAGAVQTAASAAGLKDIASGVQAGQVAQAVSETAELNRILKLSGMKFIAEDSTKSVTVQRGDTLGRIASDNGTTVDAIAKLNNISNPDRIYPGDVIKIPGGQGDPGGREKRQGPPSAPDTNSDPDHISREERALLNMIARRESSDDYNAINYKAKDALKKGKMQITGDTGHHPFEGQSGTTAAGRYQMLWNTWKTAAKWAGVDPENFSPSNQDRAALALAKWAYKNKYGGDLSKDIKDPKLLARVIDGLTPWSVKSGGPGFTTQHYASALSDVQAA